MSRGLISVDGLTKEYSTSQGTIKAVDDVSLDIGREEVVGLLGPNGAGKTTTIKCILGLVSPTAGDIAVDGIDPTEEPRSVYRTAGAVLEGARNVYWRLTPSENVRFFAGLQGDSPAETKEMREELLAKLGLESKADDPVRDLSRGMKQRVSIACALARDTPLVFLDEPTLGLDVESSRKLRREIRRLVEQESRTVVLCSHDMDVVQEICDRVVIMNHGSVLVDSTVDELVDLFDTRAYGVHLDRTPDEGALDGFDVEWLRRGEDGAEFETVLADGDRLYALMEALEAANVVVEKIESVEPDLEEIFIEITNRDEPTRVEA